MLYESDSSVPEEGEEEDQESDDLLGSQPSTSNGSHHKSQEIFTIQVQPELQSSFESNNRSKRSSGYVSLNASDPGEEPITDETSSAHEACSRASSKSNISILRAKQIIQYKISKPDIQLHYVCKKHHRASAKYDPESQMEGEVDEVGDDSDDEVTLTSRGHRRGRLAMGSDVGGSGFLSMWSAYSELLYEHEGISWTCCAALTVAFCASAQCHAYTKALKMAAWAVILILVLLCLRTYVYGTSFHGYASDPLTPHKTSQHERSHLELMEMLHETREN